MDDTGPWAYLIAHNDESGTAAEWKDLLDNRDEVLDWYRCLPHAFLVVSRLTARQLTSLIRTARPDRRGYFVVVDTDFDCDGRLPREAWELINDRKQYG